MRLLIRYYRQMAIAAFVITYCQYPLFSQEPDTTKRIKPGLYAGAGFGPSQTQIDNSGNQTLSGLLSGKKNSFSGSLEIGYLFSRYFGISSGIGFDSYGSLLSLDTYQNKLNATDTENENYELRVSASDITEEQNISFVNLPVLLELRLPFNEKIGFFLSTGVNLSFPLTKGYSSNGVFTYKGYYPGDNVLLENLPAYGFPTNLNSDADGDLELKSMILIGVASAGFDYFINKKIQIGAAAFYYKSLSTISEYTAPEEFQLSEEVKQINSLMGGSSDPAVQSLGLKLVIRYYFNKN